MKRDSRAIALLIGIVSLVFADVLVFGRGLYFRDLTRYYYPTKKIIRDTILGGDFPYWNAHWASGQPLAANPDYAVFYPLQWLTLLPGYDFWYRFHIVAHFWVAAAGAFVLLRRWKLRTESAMFGALVFSLSGITLSGANLLPILYAAVWLPWVIWAADRMLEQFSCSRFAVLSLFLSMPMLAAEPVTVAQISLMTALFAVIRTRSIRRMPGIAGAGIAAFIAGAAQLLPAFDLVRESARSRGFPFETVAWWSTPPVRLMELAIPNLTGLARGHFQWFWGTAKYGWIDPFYVGIYFGLIAFAVAVAGLTLRLPRWRPVLLVLIGAVIFAVGNHTPLLRFLYDAHIFSSFRYPEKFLFFALTPLMFFAAYAFDRLFDDTKVARRALVVVACVAAICAVLLGASLLPTYAARFTAFWEIGIHPLAPLMARLSRTVWLLGLVRCAAAAMVFWLALRQRRHWAWVAITFLCVDLGAQRLGLVESIEARFFRDPPQAIAQIDTSQSVFHQADWYSRTEVARAYFDRPEMYWVLRNGLFPMSGATWGTAYVMNGDIDRTFLLPSVDFLEAMLEIRGSGAPRWYEPLMTMTAAGYRAMYLPFDQAIARAKSDRTSVQPIIFVPHKHAGRFYFADRLVHAPRRDDFVRAVVAGLPTPRATLWAGEDGSPASGRVIRSSEKPNRARIDVEADGDALLVCTITRHKYWTATVDGIPADLVPVNLAYQAVRVPRGPHTIELRYRNPLIPAGAAISLCTAIALIVLALRRRPTDQMPASRA